MAIKNVYHLNLDIKRGMTSTTPTFRQEDACSFTCLIFDDGIEFDVDDTLRIEVTHELPNGMFITKDGYIDYAHGIKGFRYDYTQEELMEQGVIKTTVTLIGTHGHRVSVQPFPVVVYGKNGSDGNSIIELIKDLNKKINDLVLNLKDVIPVSEKGKPNGVATLDVTGKIPQSQLPPQIEAYIKHMSETVWKNQVHGLRIDKDGIMQYDTGNNDWQNVGFASTAIGGGSTVPQLLDVNITKSNSVATLAYVGVPTVQLQKWATGDRAKSYFVTSGTTFTGNTIPLSQLGIHTLYYKDSNGIEYVKTFNVTTSDLTTPTISVSVNNDDVTVNISVGTSVKKWAKGKQTIGYFQSQGTVFTGNTFKVTEAGWYTIYYKTNNGVEYTYEFEVTGDNLLNATITMNLNLSQNHLRIYKKPQLINNTGEEVTYTTLVTDSPIPNDGKILGYDHRVTVQTIESLIPSDTPKTLYYHFTLKKGDLTKVVTEPIKFGYHTANSTSTLASLSRGDLFRIDGYNDGHFMKMTSGSSNIQVIHISTSDMLLREWGWDETQRIAYGFQLDKGIGQFLNNEYYNQLPSTLRNSIINYNFKQGNPIDNQTILVNAKVGFMDEEYALSQNNNLNSDLANSGGITHTVLYTRPYPDYVGSYGTIDVSTVVSNGLTVFRYASNFGDKTRLWWHTPMFVIGNASNVTVRKLVNTENAILNQTT